MKEPRDCSTVEALQALIGADVPESLELDYKESDSLSREPRRVIELSKDVSSFANSAGGTLIYGIREDNRHPLSLDSGVDPTDFDRERLENLIHGNVRPRLGNLVVRPIPLATRRVVYAVSVGRSTTAHMAADHRYYKHFNFKAEPMEHYEVEDVMQRGTTPDLHVFLRSRLEMLGQQPWLLITVLVDNRSLVPAATFAVSVFTLPRRQKRYVDSLCPRETRGPARIELPDFHEDFEVMTFQWHDRPPLFAGAPVAIGTFNIEPCPGEWLLWEVRSTGAPKQGAVLVANDGLHDDEIVWTEVRGPTTSR